MSRLSSRKFIVTVLAVLSATGLVAFKLIEGSGYVTVVLAALAIYNTANVAQKKQAVTP